jgi:hypothetical protein
VSEIWLLTCSLLSAVIGSKGKGEKREREGEKGDGGKVTIKGNYLNCSYKFRGINVIMVYFVFEI